MLKPVSAELIPAKTALHLADLSLFQQVLLITDGTLTNILETYVGEKLHVIKIAEETRSEVDTDALWLLDLQPGSDLIERRIVLQGKVSRRNWLYAESLIAPERLEPGFRERLTHSQEPIGKLWLEHKVETFKEITTTYQEPAGPLAPYFDIHPLDRLLCRTYRVLSRRQPIMLITEKFPAGYYTDAIGRGA